MYKQFWADCIDMYRTLVPTESKRIYLSLNKDISSMTEKNIKETYERLLEVKPKLPRAMQVNATIFESQLEEILLRQNLL